MENVIFVGFFSLRFKLILMLKMKSLSRFTTSARKTKWAVFFFSTKTFNQSENNLSHCGWFSYQTPWKKPPLAQCMCLCVGGGWGGGVCVVNRWISGGRRRRRSGWSWMLTLVWSGKVQLSAVEVETFLLSAHTRANRHTEKHTAWQQCQTTSEVVSLCF